MQMFSFIPLLSSSFILSTFYNNEIVFLWLWSAFPWWLIFLSSNTRIYWSFLYIASRKIYWIHWLFFKRSLIYFLIDCYWFVLVHIYINTASNMRMKFFVWFQKLSLLLSDGFFLYYSCLNEFNLILHISFQL